MLVRWTVVAAAFLYALGAAGTFVATITDEKFTRRERYVMAAAERSLAWPAQLPELVRRLLDD